MPRGRSLTPRASALRTAWTNTLTEGNDSGLTDAEFRARTLRRAEAALRTDNDHRAAGDR
ncbi:hypothetical protein F4554_005585 [Actinopolymorpha rutila]|uniref:Uncharacterized protein n=1 Tax=Actinopolymorpha rutila TaxID=446787 RepID=A0A852ZIR3_9ACTN|nr:hypothetical protein [Actinopolymorpha rutila]